MQVQLKSLIFKFFPAFARYILDLHLEDFTKESLELSRAKRLPLLNYFNSLKEEEILNYGIESNRILLISASENKLMEAIEESLRTWKQNNFPFFDKFQLLSEDIILVSLIRKEAFLKFLPQYTKDLDLIFNIIREIDLFIAENESAAFKSYLEIQQEKIIEVNNALQLREEQLLEAQELTETGSFIWDLTERKKSVYTKQVGVIFRMDKYSNLSSFMEFVHPEDRKRLEEAIDKALNGDGLYECEYRYVRNGKTKVIWSRGKVDFEEQKPIRMKGVIMDITRRHSLMEDLRLSEERYHNMVNEVQDYAIILLDPNGNVLNWNKGAEQIKGYKGEEIIGRNFREFYLLVDREKRIPEKILEQAERTGRAALEGWRLRKDGTRFWGSIVLTALHDTSGKIIGFSKVTRDLTERKLAEERATQYTMELEEKNQELFRINAELESFNYVASHDLQEPLRKIQIYSSRLLEENTTNSLPDNSLLGKISTTAARMQSLIKDLLSFSQISVLHSTVEIVNLDDILTNALGMLSATIEELNAQITKEPLPKIKGVSFQFQQLFTNLIGNALKYHQENKTPKVMIKCKMVKGKEFLHDGGSPLLTYVCISVVDNGIGFPPEQNKKIFELFQRLHRDDKNFTGTGLGLAICKKILSNHNGFITAESEIGKGSIFNIYIPEHRLVN